MNPNIMRQAGFDKEIDNVQQGKCATCGKEIPAKLMDEFRDAISVKEYYISGMCQTCQDEVFGANYDE